MKGKEAVHRYLVDEKFIEEKDLRDGLTTEDLGMDELDELEMVMTIENDYSIAIHDEEWTECEGSIDKFIEVVDNKFL